MSATPPTRPKSKYNLYGDDFRRDPYCLYAQMRKEDPVWRRLTSDGQTAIWLVTRYEDGIAILRDHKRFVKNLRNTRAPAELAAMPPDPPQIQLLSNHMLHLDGVDHTRLRSLVNQAFTAKVVEEMEPRVRAIANELLDKVEPQGHMDLIHDYALPLPIIVIAELLGIPAKDQHLFHRWSRAFVTPSPNAQASEKKLAKTGRQMQEFTDYFRKIFAQRAKIPQPDLITSLLQVEEDGDRLTESDLLSMLVLLIVTGHETAVNLIGNGILALLRHPEQLAKLKQNPALIDSAIEEIVRYDCPVERATIRYAAEETTIHGQMIARGDIVYVVLGSLNRDPAQFADPDSFDIERKENKHLGFGIGPHYCLGAPLGRLEGRVGIDTLLQRFPDIELTVPPEELKWRAIPIMRGMQQMPLRWRCEE